MKSIRIKFVGFWQGFCINDNLFMNVLKKHYNIILDDISPDYVICSMFGEPYEYCQYDNAIRIFWSGENYTPDFNLVDYAVGYDNMYYEERYFRKLLLGAGGSWCKSSAMYHENMRDDILQEKTKFCNLIYSHDRDDMGRKKMLELLSAYKKVDSAGTYLNNMENDEVIKMSEKLPFQSQYKFSICFESVDMKGFFTEKIVHAFMADTIPVYMGDTDIKDIFNEKAFINCADYESLEQVIERIIEIDNDDELFLSMLKEPALKDEKIIERTEHEFEEWLLNIFEQDKETSWERFVEILE